MDVTIAVEAGQAVSGRVGGAGSGTGARRTDAEGHGEHFTEGEGREAA